MVAGAAAVLTCHILIFRTAASYQLPGSGAMSSVEKVLEWVNSSEAKAAKYEQEAKVEISG